MSLLDQLLPAKFKDATFFVTSSEVSGGRKTVKHEYPNSDRRSVEDLGKLQKTFSVSAFVAGENYASLRDRLINALESKGAGVLQHPNYGSVRVFADPYSVIEEDSSLGQAVFRLNFVKAEDELLPQPADSSQANVTAKASALKQLVSARTASTFKANSFLSFNAASTLLTSFADTMNKTTELFSQPIEEVAALSSSLQNFSSSLNSLLSTPSALASSIDGLLAQIDSVIADPKDRIKQALGFTEFNADSEHLTAPTSTNNDITVNQAEEITNEQVLTQQIQINSLATCYANASQATYANDQEIYAIQDLFDTQYELIANNDQIPTEVKLAVQDARDALEKFLTETLVQAAKIVSVEIKTMPVQLLGYQLYANLDRSQQLIDINNVYDVSHISGTLQVLQDDNA